MQNQSKTQIKEIFESIQGEGLCVGEKHIFVRFCKCNLNCHFCDTDFEKKNAIAYSSEELFNILNQSNSETVSFTGGEPLLDVDFLEDFLKKYKTKLNKKIYLETNGILHKNLDKIINFIDIIAADIKLESATKEKNRFLDNEKFLNIAHANKKDIFIKIIFDENIKDEEIEKCVNIAKKNNTTIILQPKMPLYKDLDIEKIFNKFYCKYKNIRLIAQTHKFLNLM